MRPAGQLAEAERGWSNAQARLQLQLHVRVQSAVRGAWGRAPLIQSEVASIFEDSHRGTLKITLMIMHLQADVRAGPFMFITVLQDLQKNCVWKCVGK